MKIDHKILIISLIFIVVLYILLFGWRGYFFANSFLLGSIASTVNFVALTRLARSMLGTGCGWLFIPLGIFRWALFVLVIFIAMYYYKALPLPLLAGVGVPAVTVLLMTLYTIIRGSKDGASA